MAQPNMTNNPNRPLSTPPVSRTWWYILAAIAVVVIFVIARGAMRRPTRHTYDNTPASGRRAPSDTLRPSTPPRDTLPPVDQEPSNVPPPTSPQPTTPTSPPMTP